MKHPTKTHWSATILTAMSFAIASGAHAAISVGTDLGGGALQDVAYGLTGNVSQITPLLYIQEFASTVPAAAQVLGTEIGFTPVLTPGASMGMPSVLGISYQFTNNSATTTFNDLRFMLVVQPDGDGRAVTPTWEDLVGESWGPAIAGDPDAREVRALLPDLSNSLVATLPSSSAVVDATNPCVGACDAEFALQWNRATLAPGETWNIYVKLVDDAALVGDGRHLVATSANTAGTQLFVGNVQLVPEPGTWALLLAGLSLVAVQGIRSKRA